MNSEDCAQQIGRLEAALRVEQARSIQLQARCIVHEAMVRQLHEERVQFEKERDKLETELNKLASEKWSLNHTLETLKIELRTVADKHAQVFRELMETQAQLIQLQPQVQPQPQMARLEQREQIEAPAVPLSQAAQESMDNWQAARSDLLQRLEDAARLALNELALRRVAEASISELEAALADSRRLIASSGAVAEG